MKGLSPQTNEDELEKHFSEYGKLEKVKLVRDLFSGESKRYAFIEFIDNRTA